ncbi:hypothetical protein Q5Y75_15830 [Ruegeria sp. 2205SS24-7]|uniref:hypothetical protein n=1 Tax=Ruegeria discodermiae TaxID=3064389 RepID=UPI002741B19A|nr:hypothetical protein [Ruegeria sp. 2205SS24-7]MDP5218698.1 hypothetical protein [Ruegeria sp. 2205SS24-7]
MVDCHMDFDRRVARLNKKHQAMARGYTARMRPDGLVVVKPRRMRLAISPRSLFLFIGAFFLFKGFILANLGTATYEERLDRLWNGTGVEIAGAFVMQVDPVSQLIANQIGPVLR